MKKQLTVGIFLEHYDPFFSGVITSVKVLRSELERRGHKVYIIAPAAAGFKDVDKRVIRTPSFATSALENTTVGLADPFTRRRIANIKFDIVHSQEVFFTSLLGLKVAQAQKVPYIQTYHTLWNNFIDQYELGLRARILGFSFMAYPFVFGLSRSAKLLRRASQNSPSKKFIPNLMWGHMLTMGEVADRVVVPSKHLAAELRAAGLATPLVTIPNGVAAYKADNSESLMSKPKAKLRILSVARHSPEKRVHVLIEALAKTKANAELVLIGEGPTDAFLKQRVSQLGLESKVLFMGHLSNGAVRTLMRQSDVLALASYNFDNQPMVIIEAIEAGLPVIYCDPKLEEGLSADNALLVGRSAASFALAYQKLQNAKFRSSMAVASKKLARNYQIKKIADEVLAVYYAAIADQQHAKN